MKILKLENRLQDNNFFLKSLIVLFIIYVGLRCFHLTAPILDRHSWNQISTAATALNIYKNPASFFQPDANVFLTDKAVSTYPQECPLFQTLIAVGYWLIGPHIWVARLIAICLAALGWWYLLKICLLQHSRLVTLTTLFIYSTNSLNWFFDRAINSDTGMVTMMLAAFYYFLQYLEKPQKSTWGLLTLTCCLAGLFKPYGLMIGVSFLFIIIFRKQWSFFKRLDLITIALITTLVSLSWLVYTSLNFKTAITLNQTSNLCFDWQLFFYLDYWNTLQSRLFDQILTPFVGIFLIYALYSKKITSEPAAALLAGNLFYLIVITNGNYVHNYYQLPFTPALSIYSALGIITWLKSDGKLSFLYKKIIVICCLLIFFVWNGKRAWNHFRLSLGPKIVGDYIQTLHLDPATKILAIESSTTRFHEMLYYSNLKGWIIRQPTTELLQKYQRLGVKIVVVHLEQAAYQNLENIQALQQNLTPLWTSHQCVNSYQQPCFIGVYSYK